MIAPTSPRNIVVPGATGSLSASRFDREARWLTRQLPEFDQMQVLPA